MSNLTNLFVTINGTKTTYSDEFQRFIRERLSYKGQKFINSEYGMVTLIDLLYTVDKLSENLGSSIITDEEGGVCYSPSDYKFPNGFCEAIQAGKVYTTATARRIEKKAYVTVTADRKEIQISESLKHTPLLLSPFAVEDFFDNVNKDKHLFDNMKSLDPTPAILTDFCSLWSANEAMIEISTGAKFNDRVARVREVKCPWDNSYDKTLDAPTRWEQILWLLTE